MTHMLMDIRISQLKEAQLKFEQNSQISIPKIQRIPKFLRQNERFYKYCSPKIISFGPIHHNNECLKEGEHYKLLWTSTFVEEYGKEIYQDGIQACNLLLNKIKYNIEELKNMFTEDAIEGFNDNDLAWILFVDGCSLLHFMENVDDQCPQKLNLKFDQLMYIWRDVLLLENQLPYQMLEIICNERRIDLNFLVNNYQDMGACKRSGMTLIPFKYPKPFHILDSSRSYLTSDLGIDIDEQGQMETQSEGNEPNQTGENTTLKLEDYDKYNWHTYKSIRDLKVAGIQVKPNKNKTDPNARKWSNVSFKSKWLSGELRLPIFICNDVTSYFFRNLIAYEMCPDVPYNYECCSFFTFMDSLVDNAEDVKELRSAGVFQNLLGSDEELAKLFNDLGDDLPTKMSSTDAVAYSWKYTPTDAVAYSWKYTLIKCQIEKHYSTKWKTWLAQAYNTHFSTPWTIIAFLAAMLALILTFFQTWYAIYPK